MIDAVVVQAPPHNEGAGAVELNELLRSQASAQQLARAMDGLLPAQQANLPRLLSLPLPGLLQPLDGGALVHPVGRGPHHPDQIRGPARDSHITLRRFGARPPRSWPRV